MRITYESKQAEAELKTNLITQELKKEKGKH
jgi:hypothetical protein